MPMAIGPESHLRMTSQTKLPTTCAMIVLTCIIWGNKVISLRLGLHDHRDRFRHLDLNPMIAFRRSKKGPVQMHGQR